MPDDLFWLTFLGTSDQMKQWEGFACPSCWLPEVPRSTRLPSFGLLLRTVQRRQGTFKRERFRDAEEASILRDEVDSKLVKVRTSRARATIRQAHNHQARKICTSEARPVDIRTWSHSAYDEA